MGTTIRREPVTTSIPAAPDYRFLNITNFGGIEKSSNPFVVESNTASDCLNVYVDEDNALSTRPRLNFVQNLILAAVNTDSVFTENSKIIGVHSLHDGYLLHVYHSEHYHLHKLIIENGVVVSGQPIININSDLSKGLKVFEQNNNIYVLTGNGYKTIINGKLEDVDGYIPTTRVGKNKRVVIEKENGESVTEYDIEGTAFESPNLLSEKYKESYFWDGLNSPLEKTENTLDVTNNYYVWEKYTNLPEGKIIKHYSDGTFIFVAEDKTTYPNALYCTTNALKVLNLHDTGLSADDVETFTTDEHNNHFSNNKLCIIKHTSLALRVYELGENFKFVYKTTIIPPATISNAGISSTGKYIWISHGSGIATDKVNAIYRYDAEQASTQELTLDGDWWAQFKDTVGIIDALWSDTDEKAFLHTHPNPSDTSMGKLVELTFADNKVSAEPLSLLDAHTVPVNRCVRMSPNGKHIIAGTYAGYVYNTETKVVQNFILREKIDDLYEHGNVPYIDVSIPYITNNIIIWIKNDDKSFWVATNLDSMQNISGVYTQHTENVSYEDVILSASNHNIILRNGEAAYVQNSNEPLVIYTKKYTTSDDERSKLAEIFKKAKLTQRFDNNTWFASDNYTFHTLYNDPTYIPLSSYNDLGETYEEITGLSIVNDNIMAAYKRNRIYIITPITVGNELTYSYTETKNIVGNDVVDAPTLTILTEMPIIVSYNGIYALNQLENVQSSDRITTLISEAINPKWLKERKEDVDKCLTLNRLYWTYFILPHKKVVNGFVKDKDYTKIYLLDNRTQSWFYWELPIYVISAMVKNNKTHFVTQDGELYTLEITDLINKYNTDVTEYYDNLKNPTIIPWHWTSQILSLNTINYSKRLIDTTFVLTDTDTSDEYALNYKFKAFRKNKNAETTELTLTNDIEYVESITKRTMIPRFNFIQFTLSNVEDDTALNNNKLRLVGLGLKYVLLGGLY